MMGGCNHSFGGKPCGYSKLCLLAYEQCINHVFALFQQITLQTLQGLQPGTQGHLLLKTENGQFQLLRVGPAPTTPGAAIAPSSTAATIPAGATYRLQSVPAVSRFFTDTWC